jgi:hypothetical protein
MIEIIVDESRRSNVVYSHELNGVFGGKEFTQLVFGIVEFIGLEGCQSSWRA